MAANRSERAALRPPVDAPADRVTADELQPRVRQASRAFGDLTFRAADIGDNCRRRTWFGNSSRMRMFVWTGAARTTRSAPALRPQIVAAVVGGRRTQGRGDDLRAIDRDDSRAGPSLPRRERNRSTDEPEAHDRDARKRRVIGLAFSVSHSIRPCQLYSLLAGPTSLECAWGPTPKRCRLGSRSAAAEGSHSLSPH